MIEIDWKYDTLRTKFEGICSIVKLVREFNVQKPGPFEPVDMKFKMQLSYFMCTLTLVFKSISIVELLLLHMNGEMILCSNADSLKLMDYYIVWMCAHLHLFMIHLCIDLLSSTCPLSPAYLSRRCIGCIFVYTLDDNFGLIRFFLLKSLHTY